MKTKLLFILLSVLFIMPVNASTTKKKKQKSNFKFCDKVIKNITRTPSDFILEVNNIDNNLQILFQSPLCDATITVTDNNRNTIIYEPQTFIYEGMMLYIYTPKAYPYTVEITSPTLYITGKIVLEEY